MALPAMRPTDADVIITETRRILDGHSGRDGALLPVLHALQAEFGYIPQATHPVIAQALALSRAEIQGVVSFYHDFRETPAGARILRLCRAEACQAMGGDKVAAEIQGRLGIGWGETSADGQITLEPVFCLGLCACAPAALIDDTPVGRIDATRLEALLAEAKSA